MAGPRRIGRLGLRLAVAVGIASLALGVFLTQTLWGKELVLREILRRAEGVFEGELSVEGISSPGLLRGFTLRGVRLTGADGRPFLLADSVMAGVSPRTLLAGDLIFSRVEFWSPAVTLERLPDRERMNVMEIFFPRREDETPAGVIPEVSGGPDVEEGSFLPPEGRIVAFRGLRIHDGSLEILLPLKRGVPPSPRALIAMDPDGKPSLRRYSFWDIELDLSEATVLTPEEEGERFAVESLAFAGGFWDTPFRVVGTRGEVRRTRGLLHASIQEMKLPASEAGGELEVEWGRPQGVRVQVQGESSGLALRDLHWIEPRLPDGIVRGPFGFVKDRAGFLLDFQDTRLTLPSGRVRGTGGLLLGPELGLRGLVLQLEGVPLEILDPWLSQPLPLKGSVGGELRLAGSASALTVEGDLTLLRPDSTGRTNALLSGTFHLGDTLGVTDFQATLAPLEWSTFESLSPLMTLQGPGALRLEATGSLPSGMIVNAEATHVPAELSPSHVTARGSLLYSEDELFLNLSGELGPLSFSTLRRDFPKLPFTGEIAGPVSLRGSLSALTFESDLTTSAGPLRLWAEFDARNPTKGYRLDAEAQEFLLSSLVPNLPDPTRLTGRVLASGSGLALDSLEGEATVFLRRGEVGSIRVDTAAFVARVEEGLLTIDALMAETGVGTLEGSGSFGISSLARSGELRVRVESESLSELRPFLMGETPVVLEELSSMELEWLIIVGAELDTIPTAAEVALEGAVRGQAILRGRLDDFSGEGSLSFQGLRYRTEFVESGSLVFSAQALPGADRRLQATLRTDSLFLYGQSFLSGEAELDIGASDGRGRATVSREGEEEYRGRGTFALDSLGGGRVNLDEVLVRFDTLRWNLGGPTSISWSPQGIEIRDFRLIRPGVGGMRVRAHGFLPFQGEGEFEMDVEEFHLDRLARIAQLQTPLEGVVALQLRRTGTAEDPRMEGSLSGVDLRYGEFTFGGLASEFQYRALALSGELRAEEGGKDVLGVHGTLPLDLRFQTEGPRIPEGEIDLGFSVDSFPAALALAVLKSVEEVQGTLTGDVHLGGTPQALEPSGELALAGGSVFIPALGVRYQGAEAGFTLNPDARVDVEGTLRSRGRATVRGSVTLSPLTNPTLDLTVEAQDFLGVARRDVEARLTGEVRLLQSYRRPLIEGHFSVDQGELRLEEFARSAEVVNLADPAFLDFVEQGATSQSLLGARQNPFLQNLMLDVEMEMVRDSWLRGRDLNVEMGGDLQVFWDRTERDLALVGELQAIRGVYTFLGRQFQVQEGSVSFLGTPGVNPNLDIEARYRFRTPPPQELRFDIIATVSGTLLGPRVSLSSSSTESFAIAESDLVSYLIFGRPTYALASGQNKYVQGAAGSLLGAAGGAGANFALGTISNQLGSVVARDIGLDFIAISQGENADPFAPSKFTGTVATTQVEIGQYITDEVFAALLWRPLNNLAATQQSQFAGLRFEWRMADLWTLEGYIEDRFSRSPISGAGSLGYKLAKVKGFFFWREWGY
jgi:hypothetical protein